MKKFPLLFLIVALSAHAQNVGERTAFTLAGQVLNMTASDEGDPVPVQRVLIERHYAGKMPDDAKPFKAERISDKDGKFVFYDIPYHHHAYFVLTTAYRGMEYTSEPIFSEDGKTFPFVVMDVYDVKESVAKLHIHIRHIALMETEEAFLVSDAAMFINPSRHVLVPPAGAPSLEFSLPEDFENFAPRRGLPPDTKPAGRIVSVSLPVKPGAFEVGVSYALPIKKEIIFPVDYPTQTIGVFTPGTKSKFFSRQLGEPRLTEENGEMYFRLEGGPFEKNSSLTVNYGKRRTPMAIIQALAVALAVIIAVAGGIFIIFALKDKLRRRPKESSQTDTALERKDALISAVAELDERYGRGEISQDEYSARRAVLKEEILKLVRR